MALGRAHAAFVPVVPRRQRATGGGAVRADALRGLRRAALAGDAGSAWRSRQRSPVVRGARKFRLGRVHHGGELLRGARSRTQRRLAVDDRREDAGAGRRVDRARDRQRDRRGPARAAARDGRGAGPLGERDRRERRVRGVSRRTCREQAALPALLRSAGASLPRPLRGAGVAATWRRRDGQRRGNLEGVRRGAGRDGGDAARVRDGHAVRAAAAGLSRYPLGLGVAIESTATDRPRPPCFPRPRTPPLRSRAEPCARRERNCSDRARA